MQLKHKIQICFIKARQAGLTSLSYTVTCHLGSSFQTVELQQLMLTNYSSHINSHHTAK